MGIRIPLHSFCAQQGGVLSCASSRDPGTRHRKRVARRPSDEATTWRVEHDLPGLEPKPLGPEIDRYERCADAAVTARSVARRSNEVPADDADRAARVQLRVGVPDGDVLRG